MPCQVEGYCFHGFGIGQVMKLLQNQHAAHDADILARAASSFRETGG
jgi:hypothetical protein